MEQVIPKWIFIPCKKEQESVAIINFLLKNWYEFLTKVSFDDGYSKYRHDDTDKTYVISDNKKIETFYKFETSRIKDEYLKYTKDFWLKVEWNDISVEENNDWYSITWTCVKELSQGVRGYYKSIYKYKNKFYITYINYVGCYQFKWIWPFETKEIALKASQYITYNLYD